MRKNHPKIHSLHATQSDCFLFLQISFSVFFAFQERRFCKISLASFTAYLIKTNIQWSRLLRVQASFVTFHFQQVLGDRCFLQCALPWWTRLVRCSARSCRKVQTEYQLHRPSDSARMRWIQLWGHQKDPWFWCRMGSMTSKIQQSTIENQSNRLTQPKLLVSWWM